jgi:anthranilate phosphoribosyltransferase
VRTIFNILGPLTNPAEPPFHVIGAFDLATAHLLADALAGMTIRRAFVIHGSEGWDEPTPVGPFELIDIQGGRQHREQRSPADYGLATCSASDLAGADAAANAAALRAVFSRADRGAHRDALLLGAALALEVSGAEPSPRAALARAAAAIDSGAALKLLESLSHVGDRA